MSTEANRWGRGELIVAALLLVAAAIMRFAWLGEIPNGLFRDEWEKGYTAYELWHTGRHAAPGAQGLAISRFLPVFIEVYEGHDRTSAIYQYATAPVVGLFGLSAFTTRFAAALSGWLTCVFVWLLARRAMSWQAGLAALASASFHITGVLFSRWAQQGSMAILFATLGVWLLFEAIREQCANRRAVAMLAALALGTAAYSYDPARLVVPLIAIAFAAVFAREIKQHRGAFIPAAILFVVITSTLVVYTATAGSARLSRIATGFQPLQIVKNYFVHFSPDFFAHSGDRNLRHGGLGRFGFAGWGTSLMVPASVIVLLRRLMAGQPGGRRIGLFLLAWLAAAPAAAALTNEGVPHALRACLMIPATALLVGYAADAIGALRGMRFSAAVVIVITAIDATTCGLALMQRKEQCSAEWSTGLIEEIREDVRQGKKVFLSAQIPYANYAALFAEQTDPRKYHEENSEALKTKLVLEVPSLAGEGVQIVPAPPFDSLSSHMAVERNGKQVVLRRPGRPDESLPSPR